MPKRINTARINLFYWVYPYYISAPFSDKFLTYLVCRTLIIIHHYTSRAKSLAATTRRFLRTVRIIAFPRLYAASCLRVGNCNSFLTYRARYFLLIEIVLHKYKNMFVTINRVLIERIRWIT